MKHSITFSIGNEPGKVILACQENEVDDVVFLYSKVYKAKDILVEYNIKTSEKGKSIKQALNYVQGVSAGAGYSGIIG